MIYTIGTLLLSDFFIQLFDRVGKIDHKLRLNLTNKLLWGRRKVSTYLCIFMTFKRKNFDSNPYLKAREAIDQ